MDARSGERRLHHDVTVIGAGWSGVTVAKYMLEEGLTVVALERRDSLGGMWYYSDDPTEKSVMKSTRTTSSATVSEMSDYPMPEGMEFPQHEQVLQYLQSYASFFRVLPCIIFNTTVTSADKRGDLWYVTTASGETYTSRFLVVCTGQTVPVTGPRETIFKDFTGSIYHAKEIKEPLAAYRNKRLLIFGGGETAADLCSDWYDHASVIYWSASRGQHFFRRYNKILPWKKPQALDKASSWLLTKVAPYHYSKPGLAWVCKWTTSGSLLAYQGHGIPEWRNNTPFMHQFINKNGHILDLVDYTKVIPKGAITACNGREVTFADGSSSEFDIIILSTGYTECFSFLPQERRPQYFRKLHKHVLDNEDPSLAFVGYIRPVVGSNFGIIEIQSRWLARIISGRVPLKPKAERLEETRADAHFWQEYFKTTVQPRDKIVEMFFYVNNMGKLAKVYPDRWALFKRNPYGWYMSVVGPYNAALFRLNEDEHRDRAMATLERHVDGFVLRFDTFLFLFLRLIHFEFFIYRLQYVKYRMQMAGIGRFLGRIPFVRFINWIWCLPKRFLFDNKTQLPPMRKNPKFIT